jgi:hypothetical protein
MCEYAIVITNIGYHLTSYLDFYTLVLRVWVVWGISYTT